MAAAKEKENESHRVMNLSRTVTTERGSENTFSALRQPVGALDEEEAAPRTEAPKAADSPQTPEPRPWGGAARFAVDTPIAPRSPQSSTPMADAFQKQLNELNISFLRPACS